MQLIGLYSTDKIIPAVHMTNEHVHIVANDKLLQPNMKAFTQCTQSLHATQND